MNASIGNQTFTVYRVPAVCYPHAAGRAVLSELCTSMQPVATALSMVHRKLSVASEGGL